MKRILFTLISLILCFIANAQITNKIWGLTLGTSTRAEVVNVMKTRNMKVSQDNPDRLTYRSSSFRFGGAVWNYINLEFHKDKLVSIGFYNFSNNNEDLTRSYESLINSLDKKYSKYNTEKEATRAYYTDKNTSISAGIEPKSGPAEGFVSLIYFDLDLLMIKGDAGISEL